MRASGLRKLFIYIFDNVLGLNMELNVINTDIEYSFNTNPDISEYWSAWFAN